jgi:hypothetical protein
MLNPFKEVNWNPGRAERRKFALSLMLGFPVIAAVFTTISLVKTHAVKPFCFWLAAIGFGIGLLLWLLPHVVRPFYVVWYVIGCSIGIVMSNLILMVFYFLVLTPTGLILRVLGRRPLSAGFDKQSLTYWHDAPKPRNANQYERQF